MPLLVAAVLLGGCEPARVALESGEAPGVKPRVTTTRCPIHVRNVVDARKDPQGLGRTMYTQIDDDDGIVTWLSAALHRAGFGTMAERIVPSRGIVVDIHIKTAYIRPERSSRVANVVLGVQRADDSPMRIFRGSNTSVHVSSSSAAVTRDLESALAESIELMRRDLELTCPASAAG